MHIGAGLSRHAPERDYADIVVPFELVTEMGVLSFITTTTVFGTPVDVTVSELALESFFPADAATTEALNRLAQECAAVPVGDSPLSRVA